MLLDEVAGVIEAWSPPGNPAEVAGFARRAVARSEPARPARARALLFAASRLGVFCVSIGLELDAGVCLRASVIERFVISARVGDATRRTLRTNLRFLARRALVDPTPVALPRERAKAPYSPAEIAS